MPTPTIAANAYATLARMTDATGATGAGAAGARINDPTGATGAGLLGKTGGLTGPSFEALVKDAVGAVVQSGRQSDVQAQSLAEGKANLVDVVTAVADTEAAVETLVSVRDKVVQAYQSIMQMTI